jgi:hypothetical protein
MKTLEQYVKESLLDDIDDLEIETAKNVRKQDTIGKEYEIDDAVFGGSFAKFKKLFDIKKLKQIHSEYALWKSNDFVVKKMVRGKANITNQSTIDIIKLFADIVLSINKSNLNADFFKTKYSEDLINILSPAYIGKSKLRSTSTSESQLSELYRVFICDDDMYSQEVLSFFIKPIHK